VGGLTRRALAVTAAAGLLLSLVPAVAAATWATFGTPTAKSTFGTGIVFDQPVTLTEPAGRIELLLTIADAIGPNVTEVATSTVAGANTLHYTLDTSGNGHMIPNTPIVARWRLIPAGGGAAVALGPELKIVYADDRFDWQTVGGDLVRVHWYEGDAAFAAKALKLGEDAVRETSKLLGVTESKPADFFVYADIDAFYGAIGPGAHENVAGTEYSSIRTMVGRIPPDQINDPLVAVRIPHEFVHLVFDTASRNPYHAPPRWLNEGVAVYLSESYGSLDRAQVEGAARSGALIPLGGLTGQFPNGNDFFLAYAESVSAVDYMIRTHGRDALVTLIRSYAEGRTDDEAFSAALGLDMTAFGAAWMAELKAKPGASFGPQPAPPGPVPAAWARGPGGVTGSPAPTAGNGAPAGSARPTAVPAGPGSAGSDRGSPWLPLVLAVIVVVFVMGLVVARRRRTPLEGPP
jgi:hypothetical protein